MKTRKRKNIVAVINIVLFAIILVVGVVLVRTEELIAGWTFILLGVVVMVFSSMSLMKRKKK